jgi:hypothetical protein
MSTIESKVTKYLIWGVMNFAKSRPRISNVAAILNGSGNPSSPTCSHVFLDSLDR